MVSVADAYHVIEAMIPLYVTMILAYISVKWWKLFTPEDCSGINKFVANIMIPILSFRLISNNNPYDMNLKLVLSDILQKLLALLALAIPTKLISKVHSDWFITGFSVSTLPNTLIMGIPILEATYGDIAAKFLSQIVVLQSVVWYNLLLFMFEYRAAQALGEPETTEPTDVMEAQERTINIEGREAVKSSIFKRKLFLFMLTKLMKNPNSYSTLIGLIWASICFRWGLKLPQMIDKSISLLSDGGLGMAMFSLGIFTASQRKIIACGSRTAAVSMAVRFIVGPALMATACFTTGLKGEILSVAIVQAALPQGIVPFVFAKEYNLHPDILSTGVIFGMLIALPVALSYYILLKL